ncbi:MAG: MFS transporter [Candidatus Moranbacteria bacterium]|nr:MFS transporter [Candidatus Moranbacteria bacterium]
MNNLIHQEKLNYKIIFFVNVITFLMGFSTALLTYITSAYFKKTLGTENIAWTYLVANIILLIILLNIHHFVRIIGKTPLFHLINVCKVSIFVALILINNTFANTFFLMIFIIFDVLAWTILSMILESCSIDKDSGKIYGFNFTLFNAGFIIAPIISTNLLDKFGFNGVFSLVIIMNTIIFLIAFFKIKQVNHRYTQKINFKALFKKLSVRKDILNIFLVSISLRFFYALMVIYTPLYLLNKGLDWSQIGVIFTIMLIPFILIQYPAGLLADKKFGEKEIIFISFIIMGVATIIFYLTDSVEVTTLAIILLFSRIGAALIEILQSSYFYKRIDGNDIEMISFFQTAKPIAYILAPAISSILLIFFEMKSIFILSAIISFATLYPVYKLVDNKSESEM